MDRQSTSTVSSEQQQTQIKLPSFSALFASIQPEVKQEPLPVSINSRRDWNALNSVAAREVSQSLPSTSQWRTTESPSRQQQRTMSPQQNQIRLPSMQLSPAGGHAPLIASGLVGGPQSMSSSLRGGQSPPGTHQRRRSNSLSIHPYASAFAGRTVSGDSYDETGRRTSLGGSGASAAHLAANSNKRQSRLASRSPPADHHRNGSALPSIQQGRSSPGPPHVVDYGAEPGRARAASFGEDKRSIPAWASEREGAAAAILSRTSLPLPRDQSEGAPIQRQGGSSDSLRSLVGTSSSGSGSPGMKGAQSTFGGAQYERQLPNPRLPTPDMAALQIGQGESWRAQPPHLPPIIAPSFGTQQRSALPPPPVSRGGYVPGESNPHAVAVGASAPPEVGRYACPHCPKRFARPSSLRIHIHSHTGEKPFSCEHCHRGFSVQSNLRRHLKIHRTSGLATAEESEGGGSLSEEEGSDDPMAG